MKRRCVLRRAGSVEPGKVIPLPHTLAELQACGSHLFDLDHCVLYLDTGGEVDDMALIRDNDVILAGERGDVAAFTGHTSTSTSTSTRWGAEPYDTPPWPAHTQQHALWPRAQPRQGATTALPSSWLRLCVGGADFMTTRDSLQCVPGSLLAELAEAPEQFHFIDRDPFCFPTILNYLRLGELILDDNADLTALLLDAKYYRLADLQQVLEDLVEQQEHSLKEPTRITRNDMVKLLLSAPSDGSLRGQGMDFQGADLSRMDLKNANFKMANLTGCNLSECNLENCNFEKAVMMDCNLTGANIIGALFSGANLTGATLASVNGHDPSLKLVANFEGANMTGVDLSNAALDGSLLRVACLKGASLFHCSLRRANLACADLSNVDFTGCDLMLSNLRGANTVGARFHKEPCMQRASSSLDNYVIIPAPHGHMVTTTRPMDPLDDGLVDAEELAERMQQTSVANEPQE